MIKQTLSIFFCLITFIGYSQSLQTTYSLPFEEPEEIDSKIFQCANGNTLFFRFSERKGISIDLYNRDRKKSGHVDLNGGRWNPRIMNKSAIRGMYNMGNTVVIFLEQLDARQPVLHRIILSAETARPLRQEKIAEIDAYSITAGYSMAFGGVGEKSFQIAMSPTTDAYAVVAYDPFESETSRRILVMHFDSSHHEIGRSYFENTTEGHKYINYIGMVVNGTKEVVVCSYGFNTAASGGKTSRIIFSRLRGKTISHHSLETLEDMKNTTAIFSYNMKLNRYELLAVSFLKKERDVTKYTASLLAINPEDLNIVYSTPLDTRPATEYRDKNLSNPKDAYVGMPIGMYTNPDGSNTIVMEERSTYYNSQVSFSDLGDIGIVDYNSKGEAEQGYVVGKKQQTRVLNDVMSMNATHNGYLDLKQEALHGNAKPGFYSFDYYGTPAGRFVIFNDHPENETITKEKDRRTLSTVSEGKGVCYRLSQGVLSRINLFNESASNVDNRFAYLSSGNYSQQTGDYAVMVIERNGREKRARIAWVHLN